MTLLTTLLLPAAPVFAVDVISPACEGVSGATFCDPGPGQNPDCNGIYGKCGIITKAVEILSYVIGVAAVIMIIVGGFKYITSTGDSNNINSAKNTILYAVIGLVVAILARTIIVYVISRL